MVQHQPRTNTLSLTWQPFQQQWQNHEDCLLQTALLEVCPLRKKEPFNNIMNIFGNVYMQNESKWSSILIQFQESVRNTNRYKWKKVIYSNRNSKAFEYHRGRSCFLMLEPMMASIYIIAYQTGTHSVYSHSSTIQLVLWHVLTEIHVNKIHQVHHAIVESIILLQTLDVLTTAETQAARTTTGLWETFT